MDSLSWLVGLIAIATAINTSLLIAMVWTIAKPPVLPEPKSAAAAIALDRRLRHGAKLTPQERSSAVASAKAADAQFACDPDVY